MYKHVKTRKNKQKPVRCAFLSTSEKKSSFADLYISEDGRMVSQKNNALKSTSSLPPILAIIIFSRPTMTKVAPEDIPVEEKAPDAPTKAAEPEGPGFDTLCLHGAYKPDTSVTYGLGQGAPRGVPLHRTTP